MITKIIKGDLLSSNAQTLVNTVNCVGVMGKGIALEFKKRFPEMYEDYVRRCASGQVKLGRPYLYRSLLPPHILNFPTKQHWRSVSRLEDIVQGLEYLEKHYHEWGITSLAVPPLGCGSGGLDWRDVGPILYRHLHRLDIPIVLYGPLDASSAELETAFLSRDQKPCELETSKTLKPGWAALVEILNLIEQEPFHWPVGRTTFQKIVYFATFSGIPTELVYQRGSYGPFSPELKQVITILVNRRLVQERRLGRMFGIEIGPAYRECRETLTHYLDQWTSQIRKVADLILRMSTTRQAELAATVHFVAHNSQLQTISESDVISGVLDWKQRRQPPFDRTEVALTVRYLAMLGWITVRASEEIPLLEEEVFA